MGVDGSRYTKKLLSLNTEDAADGEGGGEVVVVVFGDVEGEFGGEFEGVEDLDVVSEGEEGIEDVAFAEIFGEVGCGESAFDEDLVDVSKGEVGAEGEFEVQIGFEGFVVGFEVNDVFRMDREAESEVESPAGHVRIEIEVEFESRRDGVACGSCAQSFE